MAHDAVLYLLLAIDEMTFETALAEGAQQIGKNDCLLVVPSGTKTCVQ